MCIEDMERDRNGFSTDLFSKFGVYKIFVMFLKVSYAYQG